MVWPRSRCRISDTVGAVGFWVLVRWRATLKSPLYLPPKPHFPPSVPMTCIIRSLRCSAPANPVF
jgi:hypothetical protein